MTPGLDAPDSGYDCVCPGSDCCDCGGIPKLCICRKNFRGRKAALSPRASKATVDGSLGQGQRAADFQYVGLLPTSGACEGRTSAGKTGENNAGDNRRSGHEPNKGAVQGTTSRTVMTAPDLATCTADLARTRGQFQPRLGTSYTAARGGLTHRSHLLARATDSLTKKLA